MIGDTKYDIEGALGAGVDSIAVTYGYGNTKSLRKSGATFIADSVKDISDILFLKS
ncbi:MAG: HAD hydrolase-like protein [Butyrivibrio sp.]|nr:HAD hydrolase-like protein [Butyrivibrio sp.]